MRWNTASARQQFADLVREASREPQPVYNRDRLVAVVVDAPTFAEFEAWRASRRAGSLAEAFAPLRALAAEDGFTLEQPSRQDRANAMET